MNAMSGTEAARRCLEDPDFALQVARSDEWPAVREAVMADLADAGETTGFVIINWRPEGFDPGVFSAQWAASPKINVGRLASRPGGASEVTLAESSEMPPLFDH